MLRITDVHYHAVRRVLDFGQFNPHAHKQLKSLRVFDKESCVVMDRSAKMSECTKLIGNYRATLAMLLDGNGYGLVRGMVSLERLSIRALFRSHNVFIVLHGLTQW